MDEIKLLSYLEKAREDNDMYVVARAALMLEGRGYKVNLTQTEQETILQCLANARQRKGILGLEDGYELARWLLICRLLFPERKIVPTNLDKRVIQEACDTYCKERIFKQVASLVHMGEILDIPINLHALSNKKRKLVSKIAATLA